MNEATAHLNAEAEKNRRTHLGPFIKSSYGSGALVDGMTSTAVNTFLFFYMTAVCGLSGSLAGLSLVIALVIDSVADPLIGSLSDNTHTRFGRRHPWMLASALPLGLSLGLLFSAPAMLKGAPLFAWLTAAAIGTRVSLSLFVLPHAALGAEISDDYAERSNIVGYRVIFNVIASILCPALVYVVFMPSASALLHRAGYVPFGWVCAGIAVAAAVASTLGTFGVLPRLHRIEKPLSQPLARFLREMGEIFRNRSFLILFIGSLIYFISLGITNTLGLHNAKFFWNFSNATLQWLNVTGAAGAIAGIPFSSWLERFVDKHKLLMVTIFITCAGQAIVPLLRIGGVLPAGGLGLLVPIFVLFTLNGTAQVVIAITYYSMTADAADEHELIYRARREGLYFAGLQFSSKAASALGAFVAGIGLDLIGFPSAIAEKGANFHIPSRTVIELALINGPGAYILMSLSAVLILFYRLDRAAHARILAELSARRTAELESRTGAVETKAPALAAD
jgi:GPH family glycoside/pentoside/hexuronide:cation symporter